MDINYSHPKENKLPTWLSHMQSLKHRDFNPEELVVEDLNRLLQPDAFNPLFYHSVPMMYLLDYTTGKYVTMSQSAKQVMGLDPEGFMEGGVEFTLRHYHPAHFKLFNEKIFSDRIQFIKNIAPEEQKNYIFSYNHRFKNKRGEYLNLLQRNCFIRSDAAGNPLLSFGMIINIEHYNREGQVVHLIEKVSTLPEGLRAEFINKTIYWVDQTTPVFSKREREVLLWIAEGLTSKEIADRLYISEHTVINHRRHMQEKTNALNTTALVSYAIRNGYI